VTGTQFVQFILNRKYKDQYPGKMLSGYCVGNLPDIANAGSAGSSRPLLCVPDFGTDKVPKDFDLAQATEGLRKDLLKQFTAGCQRYGTALESLAFKLLSDKGPDYGNFMAMLKGTPPPPPPSPAKGKGKAQHQPQLVLDDEEDDQGSDPEPEAKRPRKTPHGFVVPNSQGSDPADKDYQATQDIDSDDESDGGEETSADESGQDSD